jgi:hypothetical protein
VCARLLFDALSVESRHCESVARRQRPREFVTLLLARFQPLYERRQWPARGDRVRQAPDLPLDAPKFVP